MADSSRRSPQPSPGQSSELTVNTSFIHASGFEFLSRSAASADDLETINLSDSPSGTAGDGKDTLRGFRAGYQAHFDTAETIIFSSEGSDFDVISRPDSPLLSTTGSDFEPVGHPGSPLAYEATRSYISQNIRSPVVVMEANTNPTHVNSSGATNAHGSHVEPPTSPPTLTRPTDTALATKKAWDRIPAPEAAPAPRTPAGEPAQAQPNSSPTFTEALTKEDLQKPVATRYEDDVGCIILPVTEQGMHPSAGRGDLSLLQHKIASRSTDRVNEREIDIQSQRQACPSYLVGCGDASEAAEVKVDAVSKEAYMATLKDLEEASQRECDLRARLRQERSTRLSLEEELQDFKVLTSRLQIELRQGAVKERDEALEALRTAEERHAATLKEAVDGERQSAKEREDQLRAEVEACRTITRLAELHCKQANDEMERMLRHSHLPVNSIKSMAKEKKALEAKADKREKLIARLRADLTAANVRSRSLAEDIKRIRTECKERELKRQVLLQHLQALESDCSQIREVDV